jgi:type II secretory pathway pseudopilin PulG
MRPLTLAIPVCGRRVATRAARRGGFTAIELIVVLAMIIVLLSIVLPTLARAREHARYVRWQAYSKLMQSHPDMLAYFNLEQQNAGDNQVWNRASGSPTEMARTSFEPRQFNAFFYRSAGSTQAAFIANDAPETQFQDRWGMGRWHGKNSLEFRDIEGKYLRMKHHPVLNMQRSLNSSFTLFASFRADNINPHDSLISKAITTRSSYGFLLTNDGTALNGRIDVWIGPPSPNPTNGVLSSLKYKQDTWQVAVMRYDGNATNVFLNGQKDPMNLVSPKLKFTNPDDVTIGADPHGIVEWLYGSIDEVGIMQNALSDDQIREMHRVGAIKERY